MKISIVSIAPLACISTFDSKKILLHLQRLDICPLVTIKITRAIPPSLLSKLIMVVIVLTCVDFFCFNKVLVQYHMMCYNILRPQGFWSSYKCKA